MLKGCAEKSPQLVSDFGKILGQPGLIYLHVPAIFTVTLVLVIASKKELVITTIKFFLDNNED